MKKHTYRAVSIKSIGGSQVQARVRGTKVIVGVDIAKEKMVASLMLESCEVIGLIKWSHPSESGLFVNLVEQLRAPERHVEVVMEPSGVYGDALRYAFWERGLAVHRVSPKRSHDAAEVYDGVPSLFDPKCAQIVAKLHLDGASELWERESDDKRKLAAALRVLEVHAKELARNRNRLEGYLTRHWPELGQVLDPRRATALELLIAYGGPRGVAADPEGASERMRIVSRGLLRDEVVQRVIESAQRTFGVPPIDEEERLIRVVAAEARRAHQLVRDARRRVAELTKGIPATEAIATVVGRTTAAVVVAAVGDPANFASPRAFVKSAGLNLKEKSSGQHKGALHITKRGSGVARMYLYLAVLRLLQCQPVIRAWYVKKVSRQGGAYRSRAVIAIMRKLLMALWHVGRGAAFQAQKLFDSRRLEHQLALHDVPLGELFGEVRGKSERVRPH